MLSEPFRLIKVDGPKTVKKILTANILKVDDYAALKVRSRIRTSSSIPSSDLVSGLVDNPPSHRELIIHFNSREER